MIWHVGGNLIFADHNTRKDKRNEINTSNMTAEAYAGSRAKFNDFNHDGILQERLRHTPVRVYIVRVYIKVAAVGITTGIP